MKVLLCTETRSCVAKKEWLSWTRSLYIYLYWSVFRHKLTISRRLFWRLRQLRATKAEYFQHTENLSFGSLFSYFTTLYQMLKLYRMAHVRTVAKYSYESGRIYIMSYFNGRFYSGIWLTTPGYKAGMLTITQRCCVPTFRYRILLQSPRRKWWKNYKSR